MQFDIKKYKLDLIAIVLFAVISLLYCYPQLQGKKLNQHDNISWQGMAHEAMTYHEKTGEDVMWSNSMFGGMPTFATYVGAMYTDYPYVIQTVLEGLGKPAYFFFIAMLCFYLLMQVLNVNKWLSVVGGVAYAFASYNAIIIGVGHDTKMLTMGYLPAALAGLMLIFQERRLTGAAVLGITMSLIVANNHFQVIYYFLIMFVCYWIVVLVMAVKGGTLKQFGISTAVAAGVTLLGVATNLTSIIPTNEYSKETMRGGASELSGHDKKENGGLDKEYAFRWSNSIGETFCIMIPYLYGGSSMEPAEKAPKTSEAVGGKYEELPLYWGSQPFVGGPVYFGAVVCFLFLLSMLIIKSPQKWWVLAASAFWIMYSWGKNFDFINYALFDHLPMLNKFRTPSMSLVIPQFLFPFAGIWGLQIILNHQKNDFQALWKNIKIAAGVTAGLCILLGVGGNLFFTFSGVGDARLPPEIVKLLREDRASLAAMSGLKSAIYIVASAALLWAFMKEKIKKELMIAGIGLIMVIDLVPVAMDYLNSKNYQDPAEYESVFEPRPVDKQIMKDPDPYYRVLDLSRDTYNDAVQAYFHKCIGGYHPAKMEMYQDLIDRQMGQHGYNQQVLDMLNTKYIIVGGQQQGGSPRAIPNPNACGNAWFVDEVKWANSADEEMNGLNAPSIGDTTQIAGAFDARKTAVMRNTFKTELGNFAFGKDSSASIKLSKYGLNDISFVAHNGKDGLAVFSDIYYANGWKAFVDGKETTIMKANYVLRSIKIPSGDHKIDFQFRPKSYYGVQKVALVSSILLIGLCLIALYPLVKKGKEQADGKLVSEKK